MLVAAGFGFLAYKRGRDRRYVGSPVDAAFGERRGRRGEDAKTETVPLGGEDETPVEFVPPDDLRPGQVGTLVDFTAHPLDVTATIVDLAVRGYLVIEEKPDSNGRKPDWKLTKKKEPDGLEPYEVELMKGLFGSKDEVELSDLRYKFASKMGEGAEGARRRRDEEGMVHEAARRGAAGLRVPRGAGAHRRRRRVRARDRVHGARALAHPDHRVRASC